MVFTSGSIPARATVKTAKTITARILDAKRASNNGYSHFDSAPTGFIALAPTVRGVPVPHRVIDKDLAISL
jgi:hypothetical protein